MFVSLFHKINCIHRTELIKEDVESCPSFDRHIIAPTKTDEATYYETLIQIWNQSVHETLCRSKHFKHKLFYLLNLFLGAKKRLYKRLCRSIGPSVRWSVRPHNTITWKTSYVAIASRRGGGRGKLVTSLFLRA
jgi:hypothetical protein